MAYSMVDKFTRFRGLSLGFSSAFSILQIPSIKLAIRLRFTIVSIDHYFWSKIAGFIGNEGEAIAAIETIMNF